MSRLRLFEAIAVAACLLGHAVPVRAQTVEITPFTGYRFGNDFFELIAGQSVDLDGAAAFGGVVDIDLSNGLQFEGLFTHQAADVTVVPVVRALQPAFTQRMSVDHWQAGGLQEFGRERVRPFLTTVLGLTRYAAEADSEVRFAFGAGGGVKIFPTSSVGLRLDGRLFGTFIDAGGTAIACGPGFCFFNIHAFAVWQAEFSAGVVFKLR